MYPENRNAEDAIQAHLDNSAPRETTPNRVQRLSLFWVERFYDQINAAKGTLEQWSKPVDISTEPTSLDTNWVLYHACSGGWFSESVLLTFHRQVCRRSGRMVDHQKLFPNKKRNSSLLARNSDFFIFSPLSFRECWHRCFMTQRSNGLSSSG